MLPILLNLLFGVSMHWTSSFELPFRARRSGSCGARVRLRHTVTYLQARQCRSCVQGVPPQWQVQRVRVCQVWSSS